ncbi:hypothetical protein LLG46_11620 [bacterium]|nr:hypothetical protein [bacterium]
MATIAVVLLSGLVLLTGISIYSALMLSKRTDEMVADIDSEDESPSPLKVHFPDSVMRQSDIS